MNAWKVHFARVKRKPRNSRDVFNLDLVFRAEAQIAHIIELIFQPS